MRQKGTSADRRPRLQLSKESLRRLTLKELSDDDLQVVAGGGYKKSCCFDCTQGF